MTSILGLTPNQPRHVPGFTWADTGDRDEPWAERTWALWCARCPGNLGSMDSIFVSLKPPARALGEPLRGCVPSMHLALLDEAIREVTTLALEGNLDAIEYGAWAVLILEEIKAGTLREAWTSHEGGT